MVHLLVETLFLLRIAVIDQSGFGVMTIKERSVYGCTSVVEVGQSNRHDRAS